MTRTRLITVGTLLIGTLLTGTPLAGCSSNSAVGTERAVPLPTVKLSGASGGGNSGSRNAVGRLVRDFPTEVIPVMPGATVTGSAVSDSGGLRQVSLSGTTTQSLAAVVAYYRHRLGLAGFAVEGKAAPITLRTRRADIALGRSDGSEVLIIAVVDAGALRSFSVGGTMLSPTPTDPTSTATAPAATGTATARA